MSQSSPRAPILNGRKRKPLESKNQPKMTNYLSSPKRPKNKEPLANFKSKEERYKNLLEHANPKIHSKKQVIQIDSDASELDIPFDESPIFPRKAVKVAKKPLVPYKSNSNSEDSHLSSPSKKEKPVSNPLEEKKTMGSFHITKKTEGTVTKFSSEYIDEPEVPAVVKKKRLYVNPADSMRSQIDISCTSLPKRKNATPDDSRAKRQRREKNRENLGSTSSSTTTARALKEKPKVCNENQTKEDLIKRKSIVGNENTRSKKRIIRKSALLKPNSPKEGYHLTKKMLADAELVNPGVQLAYLDTQNNLNTLLNMQWDRRICYDLDQAVKCERTTLANHYHINFEFQMKREDHEGALSSLRCISRSQYPNKKDLHAVVYKIVENTNERSALHRAQDLLYKVLSHHPPVDETMRQYYSYLLSSRQNETDASAPWEQLLSLLEEVLSSDETNNELPRNPSTQERRKAHLGFIVQLLYEDFYCWINCSSDHSENLRNREEMPLIANVLWPQSAIPVLNSNCRELIKLHITALQSQPEHLFYTQPLVKMMGAITQLVGLSLPLKFRKPNEHTVNLAREIISLAGDVASESYLFTSFGLRELEFLLPVIVLKNMKPEIGIAHLNALSLKDLVETYLAENGTEPEKILKKFKKKSAKYRLVVVCALSAYFNLYGCRKAWHFFIKQSPHSTTKSPNPNVSFLDNLFSSSFTLDNFTDDLRQANVLLRKSSSINAPSKRLFTVLCMNVD